MKIALAQMKMSRDIDSNYHKDKDGYGFEYIVHAKNKSNTLLCLFNLRKHEFRLSIAFVV